MNFLVSDTDILYLEKEILSSPISSRTLDLLITSLDALPLSYTVQETHGT